MVAKPRNTEQTSESVAPVVGAADPSPRVAGVNVTQEDETFVLDLTLEPESPGKPPRTVRVALPESVATALRGALAGQLTRAAARAADRSTLADTAPYGSAGVDEDELLPPVVLLSSDERRALFDEKARKLMGMSGEEFLRRYDAGEFDAVSDDVEDHPEVVDLVSLISFGRQESA